MPPPSGSSWTVADLVAAHPRMPGEYMVRAYLVATPPFRCRWFPIPSHMPDYGCGEVDWLTDDPFQPWVPNGNSGSTRAPEVGIRIQNGAYAAFAPGPQYETGVGNAPRLGTYLIRFSVRSTCDWASPSLDSCAGGPVFTWEIVRRLAPLRMAYPSSCPPEAVACW